MPSQNLSLPKNSVLLVAIGEALLTPWIPPMRCKIIPLPDYQVSFQIDGIERTRWHFGPTYPRPFFYPIIGPSGKSLTRMGHPGAPDHDHHRSVWFAHHKLLGIDFWSDNSDARIVQMGWLCYEEGDQSARMAVNLGWLDGHDPSPLVTQQVIVTVARLPNNEWTLTTQSTFTPTAESIEFQKTNFGFFAIRVASEISNVFGDGKISNSEHQIGEAMTFGQPAKWVDYSGSESQNEGVTYIDHPSNPNQPTKWHVRSDGWIGASPCMDSPLVTTKTKPIQVRYQLHIHNGPVDYARAIQRQKEFTDAPPLAVRKSLQPHTRWEIR